LRHWSDPALGVRLLARGELKGAVKSDPAQIEIYSEKRYLTITGKHLPGSPVEICRAERTVAALLARVDRVNAELRAAKKVGPVNGSHAPGKIMAAFQEASGSGGFFRSVNSRALERLSDWVPELLGATAVFQPGTGGYRVASTDLQRDLEEDLSITPMGIKDFGVHDLGDSREGKRTAIDLVLEHGNAPDAVQAALWLCERMRIDPTALGWTGRAEGGPHVSEEPLPLFPPLPSAEDYPVDALGPVLSGAVAAIARKVQVPQAIAAQSVLSAAALAAQAHADVVLPYGQSRPLSLYLVTVASSGDRKSTADNEALWPIRRREKALKEEHEREYLTWSIAFAAWNAERKKIESDKKLDFESRKAKLRNLGPEPNRPLHPFLTAPDPTIEGLIKAWVSAPAALGVFTAEGGQFVGGHGMSQDHRLKTAASFSEIWDGHPIKRVRAADGVSVLHGRRLAMHLMVQPEAASVFLSDGLLRDQGLLSRILVAAPDSIAGSRLYREPAVDDDAVIRAYGARLLSILEGQWPLAEGRANELQPRQLSMSAEAAAAWRVFHDHVECQCGANQELCAIRDFAAKAAEHAARIAGVLTVIADVDAAKIEQEAMLSALTLMDWYVNEAARLQHAARTDTKLIRAQQLLGWMQWRNRATIDFRDILRLGPAAVRTKAEAEQAISVLISHGWLAETSSRPRRFKLLKEGEGG
jgi:hypothetical protein